MKWVPKLNAFNFNYKDNRARSNRFALVYLLLTFITFDLFIVFLLLSMKMYLHAELRLTFSISTAECNIMILNKCNLDSETFSKISTSSFLSFSFCCFFAVNLIKNNSGTAREHMICDEKVFNNSTITMKVIIMLK